jgi:hypothetical protein
VPHTATQATIPNPEGWSRKRALPTIPNPQSTHVDFAAAHIKTPRPHRHGEPTRPALASQAASKDAATAAVAAGSGEQKTVGCRDHHHLNP